MELIIQVVDAQLTNQNWKRMSKKSSQMLDIHRSWIYSSSSTDSSPTYVSVTIYLHEKESLDSYNLYLTKFVMVTQLD